MLASSQRSVSFGSTLVGGRVVKDLDRGLCSAEHLDNGSAILRRVGLRIVQLVAPAVDAAEAHRFTRLICRGRLRVREVVRFPVERLLEH